MAAVVAESLDAKDYVRFRPRFGYLKSARPLGSTQLTTGAAMSFMIFVGPVVKSFWDNTAGVRSIVNRFRSGSRLPA